VLFVVFHAYVLIQVVLLARTAAAYNEAVEHNIKVAADNARVRQRLANTLFAQIFAGSPRERAGLLGVLLRLMAWVTLAIAPVFVILTCQLKFLPYHSGAVTWSHRILIAFDLLVVLLLWPSALDGRREIALRSLVRHQAALYITLGLVLISAILLTFPGEIHARWSKFPN
jgi:hypothetical protein